MITTTYDAATNTIGTRQTTAQESAQIIAASSGVIPNTSEFANAIKIAIGGIIQANALMAIYPAFFPAIQTRNWADVQALIIDAQTKGIITAIQYAAIKSAAIQYCIPVTLP